jgi:predicted nucleic acid-binding protein
VIAFDTNLLVYAFMSKTEYHQLAKTKLQEAIASTSQCAIALPCLSEFWSVVTHPKTTGTKVKAKDIVRYFQFLQEEARIQVLNPPPNFAQEFLRAAAKQKVSGARVFDLQIGLISKLNGVKELWTFDKSFVGLPGLKVVNLNL